MKTQEQKALVKRIPSSVKRGQFKNELFLAMDKLNISSRSHSLGEIDLLAFIALEEKYGLTLDMDKILADAYYTEFGWVINTWKAEVYLIFNELDSDYYDFLSE